MRIWTDTDIEKKKRKKNEIKAEQCIPKTSFTFKIYCNFASVFQFLQLTNIFSTFPQFLCHNNGNHSIIHVVNASLMQIIEFYLIFSILVPVSVSADMKCPHIGIGTLFFHIKTTIFYMTFFNHGVIRKSSDNHRLQVKKLTFIPLESVYIHTQLPAPCILFFFFRNCFFSKGGKLVL